MAASESHSLIAGIQLADNEGGRRERRERGGGGKEKGEGWEGWREKI